MSNVIPVVPNDTALPAKARQALYWLLVLVGLVLGAFQAAYFQDANVYPEWLKIATAVFAFLSAALGLLAGVNVSGVKPAPPAPPTTEV